jgi:hypothetical protein
VPDEVAVPELMVITDDRTRHEAWAKARAGNLGSNFVPQFGEAAKTTGASVKTLVRWQKIPSFAAAYREARRR